MNTCVDESSSTAGHHGSPVYMQINRCNLGEFTNYSAYLTGGQIVISKYLGCVMGGSLFGRADTVERERVGYYALVLAH